MIKYILLFTVAFNSCKEKTKENQTVSISFSSAGGQMGYNSIEKITSDSLIYFYNINLDTIEAVDERKVNAQYKLSEIITQEEIESLPAIKNGERTIAYDGVDTELIVETENKKYVVVNGEKDSLWQKIKLAIDSIFKKEFTIK